jgi:hypothetical protein
VAPLAQADAANEAAPETPAAARQRLIREVEQQPDRARLAEALLAFGSALAGSAPGPQPAHSNDASGAFPAFGKEHSPQQAAELGCLCAFAALERAHEWNRNGVAAAREELFESLLALCTLTPIDAFGFVDDVLKDDAGEFWLALADYLRKPAALPLNRYVAGLLALAGARAPEARALGHELAAPCLTRLVALEAPLQEVVLVLEGESGPTPRNTLSTALLLLSGVLPLLALVRGLAKLLLGLRRRVTLRLFPHGVAIERHEELCGRTLHDSKKWLAHGALVSLERERRFARAALYGGLLILVAASYLGSSLLAAGINVGGSRGLVGSGLLVLGLGIVLHYALTQLWGDAFGRARLVIVPRRGRRIAIDGVNPERADAVIERAGRAAQNATPSD